MADFLDGFFNGRYRQKRRSCWFVRNGRFASFQERLVKWELRMLSTPKGPTSPPPPDNAKALLFSRWRRLALSDWNCWGCCSACGRLASLGGKEGAGSSCLENSITMSLEEAEACEAVAEVKGLIHDVSACSTDQIKRKSSISTSALSESCATGLLRYRCCDRELKKA